MKNKNTNPAFIKKYLNFIGSKQSFIAASNKCDICGSKQGEIIREKISWNNNKFGILPISCCKNCGFIYQTYKFNKMFYNLFYSEYYRKIIFSDVIPSKEFIKDQTFRGNLLFKFIKKYIPKKGNVIDVGSGIGTMLKPFINLGWHCEGNDPDYHFVKYGKDKLNLPVECIQAEDMIIKKNFYDLILIMGSLEHCFDPNMVLRKCALSAKKNSILVLEARGDPQSSTKNYFNHNHHRYFSQNSLELIMIKHGWSPIISTSYPITGPSRKGGIYCIGRFVGKKNNINNLIKMGKRESVETVEHRFKYFDYLARKK